MEHDKKISAYMRLYTKIRSSITGKVYKYGSKLPSKRQLAERMGVSVITVEHAYELLAEEGYIEPRQRRGYFVIYSEDNSFAVGKKPINISPSMRKNIEIEQGRLYSREDFPFSILAKTMRRILTIYGEKILSRSPNKGQPEFRRAIAEYLARSRDIMVDEDQILIGAGAEYLYGLTVQALRRNVLYGLEDPSYEKIEQVYLANGAKIEKLKMGVEGIETEALQKSNAQVLHVTPYNSYPSGVTASASKRREYIKWASKRNGILIEDDFDSEFTLLSKAEDTLFSLAPDSVIYMNTFSRTIAPSMRVGYMVIPKRLTEKFERNIGFYSCTVPVFDQLVLAEFISNGSFERHINRIRRKKRTELLEN